MSKLRRLNRAQGEALIAIRHAILCPTGDHDYSDLLVAREDAEQVARMSVALIRLASRDYDCFAGDPGKWPDTIAALALGWVNDEPGGLLHPPATK